MRLQRRVIVSLWRGYTLSFIWTAMLATHCAAALTALGTSDSFRASQTTCWRVRVAPVSSGCGFPKSDRRVAEVRRTPL